MTLKGKSPLLGRRIILFLGDSLLFYASLFLGMVLRYGKGYGPALSLHLEPFHYAFLFWVVSSYIAGLYEINIAKNSPQFRSLWAGLLVSLMSFLILLFYLVPKFEIAPKTNLAIFLIIFGSLLFLWRSFCNSFLLAKVGKVRILLLGANQAADEVAQHIETHPQLGYELVLWLKDGLQAKTSRDLAQIISDKKIDLLVVPAHIKKQSRSARSVYQNLLTGIRVLSLADFYQIIFRRISLSELEEVWFLDNLTLRRRSYQTFKRIVESLAAFALLVITLPLFLLIFAAIRLNSTGGAIYVQKRVGERGKIFDLYKFRSMYATADKNPDANAQSPVWSSGSADKRVTAVGKFLRATHLDELPQLFNILIGDMSFVGPRPERPEFDKELERAIPFYELRYLVKPGITGWAQINYPYGASVEDAFQKTQYDIYYLTHRSFILDVLIAIKTIKRFFVQVER